MKLTKDQIEQLKKMISRKGYPFIDVQYEILDHVACKIEELMAGDPKISLETAFAKVHASFGIFGFSGLEESYVKLIEKRFKRHYWTEIKATFSSTKIILPIGIAVAMYQVFLLVPDLKTWYIIMIAALVIPLAAMFFKYRKYHSRYKQYVSYTAQNALFVYFNIGMQICLQGHVFLNQSGFLIENIIGQLYLGLVVAIMAFLFLSFFLLPKVLNKNIADTEKLMQLYGEVKK
ncbi:hypothetical protein [Mongoliitalea lutea]|uniref:Uncharacterized protein n=1 Tax=Mongoliitalea lutea TaxID=849756 RepID=A0A8J3CW83_9BACT|nr:hypothetical protein [Mongoliitalea lutea]GHB34519.1 hypothetical protein GCM10008106_14910 [Mongoliitalea lutea]